MLIVGSGWCCFHSSGYKRYKCLGHPLQGGAGLFILHEWLAKTPTTLKMVQNILMAAQHSRVHEAQEMCQLSTMSIYEDSNQLSIDYFQIPSFADI